MLLSCLSAGACSPDNASPRPVVQPELWQAFADRDQVEVIVSFEDPAPSRMLEDPEGHRRAIAALAEAVLSVSGIGFVPTRRFNHLPAVAGTVSSSALARLARLPEISFIQIDSPGHGALTVAVPAIGGDVAKRDYQVTGKGVRVAVLDTGINTTHPDLSSSLVATQHCFTRGACPPGNTAEGTSAEDDHGHGSHVAGIITSDGKVAGVGFAPDAEIVAIKVNDRDDSGFASDWAAGLDWLFSNLTTLEVKVVNASVGTAQLYSGTGDCDRGEPTLARAVANLVRAGVTIFASAGNAGSTTKLSAPACNTGTIAVGATYKSSQGRQPTSGSYSGQWGRSFADCTDESTAFDQVACFSNSGPRVDIMAPGAVVVSDVLQGKTSAFRGTSQASPAAAGVAALMLECNPRLTPAEIKDILVRTAVTVTDKKNNATFPSIRAAAAVRAACGSTTDAGWLDASTVDASQPDLASRSDGRASQDLASLPRDSGDPGVADTSGGGGSSGSTSTTGTGGSSDIAGSGGTSRSNQGGSSAAAVSSSSAVAGSAVGGSGGRSDSPAGSATTGTHQGGTTKTSASMGSGGSSAPSKPASTDSGCQCDLSARSSPPGPVLLLAFLPLARRLVRRFRRSSFPPHGPASGRWAPMLRQGMRTAHHRVAVALALLFVAGCGRTELLTLGQGGSGGRRGGRDASPMGSVPDAASIANAGGQGGAFTADQGDARPPVPRISKIVAGSYTACALKNDGTVKCWPVSQSNATTLSGSVRVTDVAVIAGERSSIEMPTPKDQVWNDWCVTVQGGITCSSRSRLSRIREDDVRSLTVGVDQTCIGLSDGRVRCYGLAGDLDPLRKAAHASSSQDPVDVPGWSNVVQVSAGYRLVCALLAGGVTSCFGDVRDDVVTDASLPQTMSIPPAADLSVADEHYCVVTTEGTVVCRGCFYDGGTGGPYFTCGSNNADLAALGQRRARQIRTSYTHRCARLDDGAVRCWGSNEFGALGYTTWGAASPQHDVDGLADVVDLAVGVHFSCALTAGGEVYCWGGATSTIPPSNPSFRQITDL